MNGEVQGDLNKIKNLIIVQIILTGLQQCLCFPSGHGRFLICAVKPETRIGPRQPASTEPDREAAHSPDMILGADHCTFSSGNEP